MGSGSSASAFALFSVNGETEGAECRRFPVRSCAISAEVASRSASMARRVRRSDPRLLRHGGFIPASTSLFEYTRAPSPFAITFSGERTRP